MSERKNLFVEAKDPNLCRPRMQPRVSLWKQIHLEVAKKQTMPLSLTGLISLWAAAAVMTFIKRPMKMTSEAKKSHCWEQSGLLVSWR